MSGWDVLGAVMDIAMYSELSGMKNSADSDAIRRAIIEAKRNFIYDISRKIKLANEQIATLPQQVYILSNTLMLRLVNSKVSTDDFPEIKDKEYFDQTATQLIEIIKKSKIVLNPHQIQQSETAVQYIHEAPLLLQAIAAKSAQESLQTTNEQWQKISSSQNKKRLFTILSIIGLALTLCVACPMLLGGYTMATSSLLMGGDFFSLISSVGMFFIGVLVPAAAIFFFMLGRKPNPDFGPLKTNRESWQKQLMPQNDWQLAVSTFGDLSSEQLKQLHEERLAFLNPIFGDDSQKNISSGE